MQVFTYNHIEKELSIYEFFRKSTDYKFVNFSFLSYKKGLTNSRGFQLRSNLTFDVFKVVSQVNCLGKLVGSKMLIFDQSLLKNTSRQKQSYFWSIIVRKEHISKRCKSLVEFQVSMKGVLGMRQSKIIVSSENKVKLFQKNCFPY